MRQIINMLGAWWTGISVREQRLMIVCSVLLLVAGVYWGLLQPMTQRAEQVQHRITSEKQLLGWVQQKADRITELRGSGGQATTTLPLNQAVSSSVRQFGIELIRMQPREDELQVWIKPVPFNSLLNWLAYMRDRHGVDVLFIDLAAADQQGMVEIKRLQLKRGL